MTDRATSLAAALSAGAGDDVVRDAARAALLLELRQPVSARLVAALWGYTTATVRRRLEGYQPVRETPERAWSADDIRHAFGSVAEGGAH